MLDNKVLSKVFMWMCVGLLVTFGVGYFVSTSDTMILNIFGTYTYLILILAELAVVVFLSSRITRMSGTTAKISFLLYSFLTGLTLSSVFVVYNLNSIIYVFLIAAIIFAIFAFIGYKTSLDLSKIGTYLFMALLAVVLCSILNIFLKNDTFSFVITIISLIVFIAYVAYDVKKVIELSETDFPEENLAIYGALQLYLDFINIFLDLLRLIGNAKD